MSTRMWQAFAGSDAAASGGLLAWEEAVYSLFMEPGDRVLLVGSGSGRDLLALLAAGYRVVGVEPSPQPVERARRLVATRGYSADVIEASFEDAALPGDFDVIAFSGFVYSWIPGSAERVAALRKASSHLRSGGRIIIAYLATDSCFAPGAAGIARCGSRLTRSDWLAEPNDRIIAVGGRDEPLYQYEHVFAPGELEVEVDAAGLQIVYEQRFQEIPLVVVTA